MIWAHILLLFDHFRLRGLLLHLRDQRLELFLALLPGVRIDIPSVLLAVGPHGGVPTLKQVVVDLADAAGT